MNMNQGKNINMKEIFSQKITNEEKIIACSLLYQSETNPLKKEILFTIAYISFNWINFQKNIFLF